MSDVRTNNIPVPRTARNKRIYSGNTGISKTIAGGGGGETVLDWVSVSDTEVAINRNLTVDGDLTVQNLSGLSGDTVIVNENGTLATVREVINETPAGDIDGTNVTYTLAHLPDGLIRLYKNGQKLKLTADYSITGQTITLVSPLISDGYEDILLCDYRYVTYSPGGSLVPAIPDLVNWTAMTRGAAAQVSGFDLWVSRINKTVTLTGEFLLTADTASGSVIAAIAVSTIAEGMSLTKRIKYSFTEVGSGQVNRGVKMYVETFDPVTNPYLQLKSYYEYDGESQPVFITLTFNVI